MRVRVAAVVLLSLAAVGCSGTHSINRASLRVLNDLSARENNFGVILAAKTGKALAAFRVNNPIRAAIPDGNGGWYIGGGFIRVRGELRKRLAHIDANGRLDPGWKPEANGNGVSVTSLARTGSLLYVAGDFARLDGKPRFQLGAVDLSGGRLSAWKPSRTASYSYDGLLATRSRLITGGTSCCSEAGSSVEALDVQSGITDKAWKPHVGEAKLYGEGVYMLVSNGRAVLIRGLFGRAKSRVAAGEVDTATGRLATKLASQATRNSCLWCRLMAAAVGKHRIFASVNGLPTIVAFNRRSGAVDKLWRAPITAVTGFYGATSAYAAAVAGGRVYVTGDFDRIRGVHRNGFAALEQGTAHVLSSWQPKATQAYGTLLVPSGDRLLLGISLARQLRFDYTGLKTYKPVRTLRLTLGLSGPGRVRIGLGRGCNVQLWESSSSLRCGGRLLRWLSTVRFDRAARKRYARRLGVPPGQYFVHFVPESPKGVPQPFVQNFPIKVPPRTVR